MPRILRPPQAPYIPQDNRVNSAGYIPPQAPSQYQGVPLYQETEFQNWFPVITTPNNLPGVSVTNPAAGVVQAVSDTPHNFAPGSLVNITGFPNASYNISATVVIPSNVTGSLANRFFYYYRPGVAGVPGGNGTVSLASNTAIGNMVNPANQAAAATAGNLFAQNSTILPGVVTLAAPAGLSQRKLFAYVYCDKWGQTNGTGFFGLFLAVRFFQGQRETLVLPLNVMGAIPAFGATQSSNFTQTRGSAIIAGGTAGIDSIQANLFAPQSNETNPVLLQPFIANAPWDNIRVDITGSYNVGYYRIYMASYSY